MTTIVITPKTKEEKEFLTHLFKKLNLETRIVEEPSPNYETRRAMKDVVLNKGNKVKNSKELFTKLGI